MDGAYVCTFGNYLLVGAEYFFLFNVNFVVSYKFYCASSDLAEFALHKTLPSEKKKKRKRILYASIWALNIIYFIIYVTTSEVMEEMDNSLSRLNTLNFYCFVICTFLILVQTVLFYLSFNRIRQVRKACANEKNSRPLQFAQRISGVIVFILLIFNSCEVVFTIAQGYYTLVSTMSFIALSILYFTVCVLHFVIIS